MNLIDIHAHLNFPDYDHDLEAVIKKMEEVGCGVINVGTGLQTSREVVNLTNHQNFWASIGVHPQEINQLDENDWQELKELAKHKRVAAIGECGLDYFRLSNPGDKLSQRELFLRQIDLALQVNKPLMLHVREAYDDVLSILRSFSGVAGNVHFFSGDIKQAQQFLDLNFTLSFTGVITFTHDYDEVIKFVPSESLLAETDAPYVAPVPYRGKRNEPVYVERVIKRLAEIRGLSPEEMAEIVLTNASRVFKLAPILPRLN